MGIEPTSETWIGSSAEFLESMVRDALPNPAVAQFPDSYDRNGDRIFHHFPITWDFVLVKCRQFSVLGFTRGSLGSVCSATELRPLVVLNCTQ
jgi:hypothetical protein